MTSHNWLENDHIGLPIKLCFMLDFKDLHIYIVKVVPLLKV